MCLCPSMYKSWLRVAAVSNCTVGGVNSALPQTCNAQPPKDKSSSVSSRPSAPLKCTGTLCACGVQRERERETPSPLTFVAEGCYVPPRLWFLEGSPWAWELVSWMPWGKSEGPLVCCYSLKESTPGERTSSCITVTFTQQFWDDSSSEAPPSQNAHLPQ